MSTTHSGWETRILWALETNPGTAVDPTHLWPSQEKDSLELGEEPISHLPFTGKRSQYSASMRLGVQNPGGALGAAPLYMDGSSLDLLQFAVAHFQTSTRGTVDGGASPLYSFTFNGVQAQPADSALKTLTIGRTTGLGDGKDYVYSGGLIDELSFSWARGEAISWTPSILGMDAGTTGTVDGTATPPTGRFLQAPNIAVTWNGTAIYPEAFTLKFANGAVPLTGPSHRGRRSFAMGNYTIEAELTTWRDDSFYTHFIAPFGAETIGTLVVTATVDTSYGSFACGSAYKAIWTIYARCPEAPNLPENTKELLETINLSGVQDATSTFVVHSEYSTTL